MNLLEYSKSLSEWYKDSEGRIRKYSSDKIGIADKRWQKAISTPQSDQFTLSNIQAHTELLGLLKMCQILNFSHWPTVIEDMNKVNPVNLTVLRSSFRDMDMYRRLGLWLCSYFLGVPQPHLWEEVAMMADERGCYPGNGFYDKLAGDVYRYERRERNKLNSNPITEPIMVMAYRPVIVLPDYDIDDTEIPHDNLEIHNWTGLTNDQKKEINKLLAKELVFRKEVERLARKYLRMQIYLYFTEQHPIQYIFFQQSASAILQRIIDNRAGRSSSVSVELADIRKDVLASSDTQILNFIPNSLQKANQSIKVIGPDVWRFKGLTSCTLGTNIGIVASRPYTNGKPAPPCHWVEQKDLEFERQKLGELRDNIKIKRNDKKKPDFVGDYTPLFAETWYREFTPDEVI